MALRKNASSASQVRAYLAERDKGTVLEISKMSKEIGVQTGRASATITLLVRDGYIKRLGKNKIETTERTAALRDIKVTTALAPHHKNRNRRGITDAARAVVIKRVERHLRVAKNLIDDLRRPSRTVAVVKEMKLSALPTAAILRELARRTGS